MKTSSVLVALVSVAAAATCVALGLWQLRRLDEKRALNAALDSALAAPPLRCVTPLPALADVRDRLVRVSGVYDEARQFVIPGHEREGVPGVRVITPLLLDGGSAAVLVDRGWLAADDPLAARPAERAEPGERAVLGLARAIARGARGPALLRAAGDSAAPWVAGALDLDSLAARVPYALAPFVVEQLPGAGVPAVPARARPRPYDESVHLSYALQWFAFAVIAVIGPLALARARRRAAARG
jgi:surfeit locus 1 family protein